MNILKSLFFLPLALSKPSFLMQPSPWVVEDSDCLDLEIKRSSLPLPQNMLINGLFVKRTFEAGEIIGEYRGPIVSDDNSGNPVFDYEDKFLALNDKYVILGRSIVSYANDCIDFKLDKYGSEEYKQWIETKQFPLHTNCTYNSEFLYKGNKVFLKTTRKIKQGEEVFLPYGFEYWRGYYEYYDENGQIKQGSP